MFAAPPVNAVLVTRSVAAFAPAAVGRNVTGIVHEPRAGMVRQLAGRLASVGTVNWPAGAGFTIASAVTVAGEAPLLASVTFCTGVAATPRVPKGTDGVKPQPAPIVTNPSENCSRSMLRSVSVPSLTF